MLSLLCQEEVCHYQVRRHGGEDAFFSIDDKVQTKILHGLDTLVDYYQQAANGLPTKLTVPLIRDPPPHNTRSHGVTNLLHRATAKNESKVVFELLKCGYRNFDAKNQDGQTALHLAALYSDEDILKHLLNAKVQVNSSDSFGCQPLHVSHPLLASLNVYFNPNPRLSTLLAPSRPALYAPLSPRRPMSRAGT